MAAKKWCIATVPVRDGPNGSRKFDLPIGAILEATGNQQAILIGGQQAIMSEVSYKGQTVWIHDGYLEEIVEKFPNFEVVIPNPTADPNDAAQYMVLEGNVKHNMCGELCVAFIGKDDIETFVNKWKAVAPNYYNRIIAGANDQTTGVDALESMLSVYGHPVPGLRIQAGLTDPVIGFKISPGRMKRMLDTHYLIAGVKMDSATGKLRGQGVGHWVVVDKIAPNGVNGGWVELYNPFPNKRQEYSYDEFVNSAGPTWNGLWAKRNLGA